MNNKTKMKKKTIKKNQDHYMGFKINVYLAEATMGRGLGSSEKVWYR
jgi:dsRNA-specific ribonuclease